MNILILGGGGMVGRKLIERLARDGHLGGREITSATLHDVIEPVVPAGAVFPVKTLTSDFSKAGEAEEILADRPDVIFHLAAIVRGRRKPTSTRATASISMVRAFCSMPSGV